MATKSIDSAASRPRRALGSSPWAWLTGMVVVVGRRLWSNLSLILAIAAGFTVAVAIVVSIPVYAEAVGYRILRDELSSPLNGTRRPPFAFMYRYLGSISGNTNPKTRIHQHLLRKRCCEQVGTRHHQPNALYRNRQNSTPTHCRRWWSTARLDFDCLCPKPR